MKDEKLIVLLFAFRYAVHRIGTQSLSAIQSELVTNLHRFPDWMLAQMQRDLEWNFELMEKHKQYSNSDPLANFRRGAMLNGRGNNYAAMYEEAKAYAAKHIAHVYAHDIDGVKVDESLKDIAIYSLIELYMLKEWEKGRTQNVCGEGNCNEDAEK